MAKAPHPARRARTAAAGASVAGFVLGAVMIGEGATELTTLDLSALAGAGEGGAGQSAGLEPVSPLAGRVAATPGLGSDLTGPPPAPDQASSDSSSGTGPTSTPPPTAPATSSADPESPAPTVAPDATASLSAPPTTPAPTSAPTSAPTTAPPTTAPPPPTAPPDTTSRGS